MKPLIHLLTIIIAISATNVFAACKDESSETPDSCYHNIHRRHEVKVNYKQPTIYCKYYSDAQGVNYTVCHDCNKTKCVKEYYFDNYCDQGKA